MPPHSGPTTPHPGAPMSAWAGIVTIVLTLAGWSSVPLFLKHFASDMDGWTSNGWRYAASALIWAPVLIIGLRRGSLPRGLWRAAIVPSLFNITGQVAFAWAPYYIDPGLLTFGLRTQIIFVAAGAYLMFPTERRVLRSPVFLGALAAVFAGAMGTILFGRSAPTGATGFGIALAVGSGILFAGYALSVRKFMHGLHPVTAFAAICQYTGLGMLVLMLVLATSPGTTIHDHGAAVLAMPYNQQALLLLSAIIGIALGHVFYYISIARLGVAVSSGVIQLQPVLVAAASYYLFSEVLTIAQWISGTVAIAGAIAMLLVQHRLGQRPGAPAPPIRAGADHPAPVTLDTAPPAQRERVGTH